MRVFELIDLGRGYAILGVVVACILIIGFLVGYFVIYKRIRKGEKRLKKTSLLWWAVMICYITVVLGVTLLGRWGWQTQEIKPLFYSYRDAWYNFSMISWRNIILNILMFVPLGFLLPLGKNFFRKFWKTYLTGFTFSLIIELTQLLLSRGMFEFDDIMDNTIGAMIGYGFYAVFIVLVEIVRDQNHKRGVVSIVTLQIPLFVTVIAFSAIFISYNTQDLGNNPSTYLEKYDMDDVQVTSEVSFDEKEFMANVYELPDLSQEQAEAFAEQFFEGLGTKLDPEQNDFYEDTGVFRAVNDFSLWVNYRGASYQFTDFEFALLLDDEEPQKVVDADETEIREALENYNVDIPKEAKFEVTDNKEYKISVDFVETDSSILDGTLTCTYYGKGKFGEINNYMNRGTLHGKYQVISPKEAYEELCEGKFNTYFSDIREITIKNYKIKYIIDSKGFYQPNYVFLCDIDGEEGEINIPAIMK